ncbi:type III secretion system effector cysteine methyltransferase NleE [Escherichia albertii]|uniref:Type III secretion system effector cysteine methyltransferase NleE n=1 Tax=Escherichia coli TaxID=562 RepID=A0A765T4F2_ECOLX|nr:type III secretion system effector cysteine methyltransferase NleE [Escherichia albertii]EFF0801362.1 type III secretion system effector cysteine methyltransferase NleE [Escherichia albertii]EGM7736749.1 type III secretion system effector cysteine methyltransferase NleE [Escherichia albertii]EHW5675282.1 type III secretion system effector cysteine methyltransferase NleE [Escherichia albertii]EKD4816588.1 type III secretion system effector cysteine methyltransferase NleE [Escherichia albertii
MINPVTNAQSVPSINTKHAEHVVKNIYPEIEHNYFNEPPNIYDKKYISGITRGVAELKQEEFINEKARRLTYMQAMYSVCPEEFQPISRNEASTSEGSWLTVISGKRPMGQFSVDSLYHPDLHALCELPDIRCKIFPKENNDFLYIVVVYRNDSPLGEQRANRFIELYNIKRGIMQELNYESPELKAVKSEIIIAREMGEIFGYASEEIDSYMKYMNNKLAQIGERRSAT